MSLNTVTTGNTILAADVNQLVYVLQRQTGQTEAGQYKFAGSSYASGCWLGTYIPSLSRNTTPVSASLDTSIGLSTGLNTPSVSSLGASGFLVFSTSSTTNTTLLAGGNYTIQY